jgi:hypothetical protein
VRDTVHSNSRDTKVIDFVNSVPVINVYLRVARRRIYYSRMKYIFPSNFSRTSYHLERINDSIDLVNDTLTHVSEVVNRFERTKGGGIMYSGHSDTRPLHMMKMVLDLLYSRNFIEQYDIETFVNSHFSENHRVRITDSNPRLRGMKLNLDASFSWDSYESEEEWEEDYTQSYNRKAVRGVSEYSY